MGSTTERYLSVEELPRLKETLDEKMYRRGMKAINQTYYRLRLIVLIALTTGMRIAEISA
jgi:integrase